MRKSPNDASRALSDSLYSEVRRALDLGEGEIGPVDVEVSPAEEEGRFVAVFLLSYGPVGTRPEGRVSSRVPATVDVRKLVKAALTYFDSVGEIAPYKA